MEAEDKVIEKVNTAEQEIAEAASSVEAIDAIVEQEHGGIETAPSDIQSAESDSPVQKDGSEAKPSAKSRKITKKSAEKKKPLARQKLLPPEADDQEHEGGVAAWVLTFADLMSLLMAFFVLLYSMSEVDKAKFDEFGQSMRQALGKPVKLNADIEDVDPELAPTPEQVKEQIAKTTQDAEELKKLLEPQIADKKVEIEQHGQVIMIRMLQQGVFGSGNSTLQDDFIPVLEKISEKLNIIDGDLIVSGHTDNVPVTGKYRSNWELSAARAYSVIEVLQTMHGIPENRFVLRGFGSTRPQADNDTAENRALNRRVEIMIDQRVTLEDAQANKLNDLQKTADKMLNEKGSFDN